jgi:hypothetical protein
MGALGQWGLRAGAQCWAGDSWWWGRLADWLDGWMDSDGLGWTRMDGWLGIWGLCGEEE